MALLRQATCIVMAFSSSLLAKPRRESLLPRALRHMAGRKAKDRASNSGESPAYPMTDLRSFDMLRTRSPRDAAIRECAEKERDS